MNAKLEINLFDLLIGDQPLTVRPRLAEAIGINEAHIVQQVLYWTRVSEKIDSQNNFRSGFYWVYKTAKEWGLEFPWLSSQAIARYLRALRKSGLLVASDRFNHKSSDRTLWYRVNQEAVVKVLPHPERKKPHIKM